MLADISFIPKNMNWFQNIKHHTLADFIQQLQRKARHHTVHNRGSHTTRFSSRKHNKLILTSRRLV